MKVLLLFFVVPVLLLQGCATVFSDNTYPVQVKSIPRDSSFRIINRAGHVVHEGVTPEVVELESGAGFFRKEKYKIQVWKQDHTSVTGHLHSTIDPWWFGNFIFNLGIGAFAVDSVTGAMWKVDDHHHTILHQIVNPQPPLAPAQAQTLPTINLTLPQVQPVIPAHVHTTTAQPVVQVQSPAKTVTTTTIPISKKTTTKTTNQVQTVEETDEPIGHAKQIIEFE